MVFISPILIILENISSIEESDDGFGESAPPISYGFDFEDDYFADPDLELAKKLSLMESGKIFMICTKDKDKPSQYQDDGEDDFDEQLRMAIELSKQFKFHTKIKF